MSELLLEAKALKKTYHQRQSLFAKSSVMIKALDDVSLSLRAGESVGLVGESGSGKTTLARALVGLVKLDSGQVIVNRPRDIQYIFQNPLTSLNPRFTVEETLSEPILISKRVQRSQLSQRIDSLLQEVQIPESFRSRLPRQLSGGERQRVGIARALAMEPAVLICDEPIASLDVSVGFKILELLRSINQNKQTALLFISHDLRAVANLCRRILVMRQGRIVEQGGSAEIIQHPRQAYSKLLVQSASLNLDQPQP